jgi:hypothetical protein
MSSIEISTNRSVANCPWSEVIDKRYESCFSVGREGDVDTPVELDIVYIL